MSILAEARFAFYAGSLCGILRSLMLYNQSKYGISFVFDPC